MAFRNDYYSLTEILKRDCVYNLIVGERSNGKTYALLKYAIEKFWKDKEQFAYLRRWKEDIRQKYMTQLFSALIQNGEISKITKGERSSVCYKNGRFFLCNYDEEGTPIYNDEMDCIGFTFCLSDMEHNKSVSYPRITSIIFDEFMTPFAYLNDEFVTFMNCLSTIIRLRTDVKIFMLGNTITKYCPYFDEMGIDVRQLKKGEITVYKYGDSKLKVAVEYCALNMKARKKKESNFYFAFNNPKLNMITEGDWELSIFPHLPFKYKPKDIVATYFIEFADRCFQCEIINVNDTFFTYIHEKTTPIKNDDEDLIYTLEYNPKINYNRNIFKPINEVQKRIVWFYNTDRVYYQNNDVGDCVNNYLKICKGVQR